MVLGGQSFLVTGSEACSPATDVRKSWMWLLALVEYTGKLCLE